MRIPSQLIDIQCMHRRPQASLSHGCPCSIGLPVSVLSSSSLPTPPTPPQVSSWLGAHGILASGLDTRVQHFRCWSVAPGALAILGDVKERTPEPPSMALPPSSPLPFPKATHRKYSKVCPPVGNQSTGSSVLHCMLSLSAGIIITWLKTPVWKPAYIAMLSLQEH